MITFWQFGKFNMSPAQHRAHKFAGGEAHIELGPIDSKVQVAYVRGGSNDDLFSLAMWANALKSHRNVRTVALIPYLPGARADRGLPLGAKVYADFINSLGIDQIITIDPHSDVAPALYDRLTIVPLTDLYIWSFRQDYYSGVIAPDLGARKRAETVAEKLGVPVFQATKHRDFQTRKLSQTQCEPLPEDGHLLVVDDICDGGRTFCNLANTINTKLPMRLHLWVTHGIFSYDAVSELKTYYGEILTTDSHSGVFNNKDYVTVLELLPVMTQYLDKDIINGL